MSTSQPINVRDMAIVHRLFRQAYEESAGLVRAAPTPSAERVTFLADHIDLALAGLHIHHEDEDALLYPKLIERAPDQAEMTEQVEHEHQLITTALDVRRPRARPGANGPPPRPARLWRPRSITSTRSSSPISTTRSRRSSRWRR
jgi:hypothetical protein